MALHKNYVETTGKGAAHEGDGGDPDPPLLTYREKTDDGKTSFHRARFERAPTVSQEIWYSNVPLKRSPIIRNLPLSHSGSQFAVSSKTIEAMHDRSRSLTLKQFFQANFNVSSKPGKETTSYSKGQQTKSFDYDWEELTSIPQIQGRV